MSLCRAGFWIASPQSLIALFLRLTLLYVLYFVSYDFCISTSLRSVFMQTKAFGFAFPRHRSHFTRELRRLPATRASTVNSPCEIRRQLHKYADTNTIAQTYTYTLTYQNMQLSSLQNWERLLVTDLSGRSFCRVRILDCLVHCQRVSDQLWLEVTKRPIVMAVVMSNYLDKWQQLLRTMSCGENFQGWRQP